MSLLESTLQLLRVKAKWELHRWPELQTLQPTALVNEVVLKLIANGSLQTLEGNATPSELMLSMSRAMRDIIIDTIRAKRAMKRGSGQRGLPLHLVDDPFEKSSLEVERLRDALTEFHACYPRRAQIVEMHFFGGFTFKEIASALRMSISTVERDWQLARGWLFLALQDDAS
jgi:RNA polymerase sigma factor (TIGR02999 family)